MGALARMTEDLSVIPPLVAGMLTAVIFAFTLVTQEFVYASRLSLRFVAGFTMGAIR
jgi:hypothetical protein